MEDSANTTSHAGIMSVVRVESVSTQSDPVWTPSPLEGSKPVTNQIAGNMSVQSVIMHQICP